MTRAIITLMVMLASLNAYSQMNPKASMPIAR